MLYVIKNDFEATVRINGRWIWLWHGDGNVRHLIKLLQQPIATNPDVPLNFSNGNDDTQTMEVQNETR